MKILFICTAHNSLSQRLYLALAGTHSVTIEYALSDQVMIEAATLVQPDLIICPFLTSRVPQEIYNTWLTLIVHPGPPGDAGPSALDWVLMGDDGSEPDAERLLQNAVLSETGRSHWGVTVLQAVEEFDAGPVWAFEQFPVDIDASEATKSNLYRGPVTQAALTATLAALDRIVAAATDPTASPFTPPPSPGTEKQEPDASSAAPTNTNTTSTTTTTTTSQSTTTATTTTTTTISPRLHADLAYRVRSVTLQQPFLGGVTRHRPLLKAAQRGFDPKVHTARDISRRIRCSDSQPGCLTKHFGPSLYVYGGTVEEGSDILARQVDAGTIIACRDEAICMATIDGRGVWITHVRRIKRKTDAMLWPKVPAVSGLRDLGILDDALVSRIAVPRATLDWSRASHSTHQDIFVEFVSFLPGPRRVALVHFEFYNGAMSTEQCGRLVEALQFVASTHVMERPLAAVVLMGGKSYFSNGIALNVIEASVDPAVESWRNINRIDDVVQMLLDDFPRRNIPTVAAIRSNCAAGGVALAAACDVVIAGSEAVLNPAYRALGLHGSEYHSLSYAGRCGTERAKHLLRDMTPLSPYDARDMGLVDYTIRGTGDVLDAEIRAHVKLLVCSGLFSTARNWKSNVDVSSAGLIAARTSELAEMAKDFWSARSTRYHSRRTNFVRKVKANKAPLRFAQHRRTYGLQDEEEMDSFDDVAVFEKRALEAALEVRIRALQQEVAAPAAKEVETQKTGSVLVQEIPMDIDGCTGGKNGELRAGPEVLFPCYYTSTA